MLLLIVQVINFNFEEFVFVFFLRLCFGFTVDGWEIWLKLSLMVEEVCGHQVTPTTLFIALAFSHCLTQNSTFKTLSCLKPHHHHPHINI